MEALDRVLSVVDEARGLAGSCLAGPLSELPGGPQLAIDPRHRWHHAAQDGDGFALPHVRDHLAQVVAEREDGLGARTARGVGHHHRLVAHAPKHTAVSALVGLRARPRGVVVAHLDRHEVARNELLQQQRPQALVDEAARRASAPGMVVEIYGQVVAKVMAESLHEG